MRLGRGMVIGLGLIRFWLGRCGCGCRNILVDKDTPADEIGTSIYCIGKFYVCSYQGANVATISEICLGCFST
jgi:hypothetical protein